MGTKRRRRGVVVVPGIDRELPETVARVKRTNDGQVAVRNREECQAERDAREDAERQDIAKRLGALPDLAIARKHAVADEARGSDMRGERRRGGNRHRGCASRQA